MSQADEHQPTTSRTPYAALRVGDAERQAAIAGLGEQWRAGRLDPAEHERRTTAAFSATTRSDLDVLFADLPGEPGVAAGGPTPASHPLVAPAAPVATTAQEGTSWVARNRGVMSTLVPLVATLLFFLTKSWYFFLLVPIAYTLLGTHHGGHERDRHRGRRRSR